MTSGAAPAKLEPTHADQGGRAAGLRGAALDLVLVGALLAAALPHRLLNVEVAAAKSDEGIRLLQLFLMSVGFRPVRDIFASQGPLSLDATYPLFALLGGTLAASRLAVVTYALAEIAACYLLARQLGGRTAGLLAGLLLVVSPVYLENSRTALVEVPALLPATLAIAAAVRFAGGGRRRWLVGSALLLGLAVLIKPLVLAAGAACLAALTGRRPPGWRDVALLAGVAAASVGAVVLLVGPRELYEQVVLYRLGSAREEGWSLAENVNVLWGELRHESLAWVGLALAAVPLSMARAERPALPALVWAVASLALLLIYSPLMEKHPVVLVPPVAVLVGCAFGRRLPALAGWRRSGVRPGRSALTLALLAWYLVSVPGVLARDWQVANAGLGNDARDDAQADDVRLIGALTRPEDFILVDEPYLAYLSRRRVPPSLADPTEFRVRSGTLTGADVIAAAERHDVRALVLWSDGLRDIKRFGDWVDANFRPVKIYERANRKDRALYLRNDADLATARSIVRDDLPTAVRADFGDQLRLAAASPDRTETRPGGAITITSEWEALAAPTADYHILAILHAPDGQSVVQVQRSLGGGGVGTSSWEPGRWTVRTFALTVPPRTAPGEYTLSLAVYDSKARRQVARSELGSDGAAAEAPIGTIRIR